MYTRNCYLAQCALLCMSIVLLLVACGDTASETTVLPTIPLPTATATPEMSRRGSGGTLRLVYWEAPSILNPHLSTANKDVEVSRLTYEPLASFDDQDKMVLFLASEIPSVENGGVARDYTSVIWKLRDDVYWSDGTPFTADDVKFTFEYNSNPEVSSASQASYEFVDRVEVVDAHTVQVYFKAPTLAWMVPFVGSNGLILPRHIFEPYTGANAREAPANLIPVGTGPYRVVPDTATNTGLVPQGTLFFGTKLVETNKIVFEPNPYFRDLDKPFFSRVIAQGGGTPLEAARLLFQEGNIDYAYNLTLPSSQLDKFQNMGRGRVVPTFGSTVELIELNHTDPNTPGPNDELSSLAVPHPFFSDLRVRQAVAHAIDREAIADLYGATGRSTSNILVAPSEFVSRNTPFYPFDLDRARALLEEAGWIDTDGDGVREKDGRTLSVVYQTGVTEVRRQTMGLVKRRLEQIGFLVRLEYKNISDFYGGNPGQNLDAAVRFLADIQEWDIINISPDPGTHMSLWQSNRIPQQVNNWSAGFIGARWKSAEYDTLYAQANAELDPARRRALFTRLNDMLIREVVVIPVVELARVSGIRSTIENFAPTPWDTDTWNIQDWRQNSS